MGTKKISKKQVENMESFGFVFNKAGIHTSRTIMLDELNDLFNSVDANSSQKDDFVHAIEQGNCLKKRSAKTRILTSRHLTDLYGLDPSIPLFRIFVYFWNRDVKGRSLLAILYALVRDSFLRESFEHISKYSEGSVISRESLENFIEERFPNRFSAATLKSLAQNLNSSWTKSGHLEGKVKKIRREVQPTIGAVTFALLLGYIEGKRGEELFHSKYLRILNCHPSQAFIMAEDACSKGWIVFRRIGNTVDISFRTILTPNEMEQCQ